MKITLRDLKKVISEEVFRNYLRSAGLAPGGIGSGNFQSTFKPLSTPFPGLGDEKEEEEEFEKQEKQYGKEQQKSYLAQRVRSRKRSQ